VLASLDGVALDSVGLDLMNAQSKNNSFTDAKGNNIARILIRENATTICNDMAEPEKAPIEGGVYAGRQADHEPGHA